MKNIAEMDVHSLGDLIIGLSLIITLILAARYVSVFE
jgi:hypothetical protein